eukprot:COSAG01_NODE_20457_length_952_cov_1.364596_1_plen_68_part_10
MRAGSRFSAQGAEAVAYLVQRPEPKVGHEIAVGVALFVVHRQLRELRRGLAIAHRLRDLVKHHLQETC